MTTLQYVEKGALKRLPEVLRELRPKSVLLVHGQSFPAHHPQAAQSVEFALKEYQTSVFACPSGPFLELSVVQEATSQARDFGADLVVAIGGGRIMDLGKLIAFGLPPQNSVEDYIEGKKKQEQPVPLVAVPTTAGSGSQATHFAVIFKDREKYSVAAPGLLPRAALVEPAFLRSCPRGLRAASGLDALCQGVESYWSVQATTESREYAAEAIALSLEALVPAVHSNDPEALRKMALAAHRAGQAINISFTTAAHACSYVLTTHYGVPHGHAVALLLARLVVLNMTEAADETQVGDPKGAAFVRDRFNEILRFFRVQTPSEMGSKLLNLVSECGEATRLQDLGVEIETLLSTARPLINLQRLGNNPIRLNWEKISNLYRECY